MNWFFKQGCRNPVFINLLSVIVIVLGIFSSIQLKRELFPPMNMDTVRVTLAMDNSSTAENIDENIIRIVYPYLQGIEGVKQIRSVATKSSGTFYLDIYNKANIDKVKQKVKDAIDRINDLPKGVEKPIVETIKHHENAIDIAVYGEGFSHIKLKTFLQEIKSEIISKKIASLITFKPERKIELRITLPIHTLQSKGLTIEDVGKQLKAYTIDATAGKIRGDDSFMVLESDARKLSSDDFEEIPIQFPSGEFIPLKHLGTVEKDFKEDEAFVNFNGDPAVILSINKAEHEDITEISRRVREYLDSLELPSGLHATAFNDTSKIRRA